ncbi:hypothetical protein ACKWTF_000093 [Chironomus riparius]
MHIQYFIDSGNNKPCLRIKFTEDPIHDFRVTMKQVFANGRTKILDVEDIPLERIIGDEEHLYIKKNGMDDLEEGSEFRFVCDVKLTLADKTLISKFSNSTYENLTRVAHDEKFHDFTIKFKDGKELKVVKFILASKSRVFLKMFTTNMIESKTNEMFIPDVDFEVMKVAVNFMNNGGTEGLDFHIFDVLIMADKYEIFELKRHCEMKVSNGLTTKIIADVLLFAYRYNADFLKKESILFIQSNWDAIKGLEEFKCIYTYSDLILDIFETFNISNYPIKSVISNL